MVISLVVRLTKAAAARPVEPCERVKGRRLPRKVVAAKTAKANEKKR